MDLPDPVYVLRSDGDTFHSLLFIRFLEEEYLLTGTVEGAILTFDLRSGRSIPARTLKSGTSTCLALHYVDDTLISQDKHGFIKVWALNESQYEFKQKIVLDYFGFCKSGVVKDSSGRLLIVCPKQKAGLEIFDARLNEKISTLDHVDPSKLGELMAMKVVNKSGTLYILAAYESGDIAVWDLITGKVISLLNLTGKKNCPMAIDYSEIKGRGICGSNSDKIIVFKTDNQMGLSVRHEYEMKSEGVGCIKIRPDNKLFVIGCWDGKLRLFAMKTCRPLAVLDYHTSSILDVTFSAFSVAAHGNKMLMAATSKDGKTSLWDVYS